MNPKIIYKISFYLILLLFTFSCSKDDDTSLFNQSPNDRIESKKSELQNLLVASDYKVVYFPNNKKFGGFTFLMKFKNDGTVDMTSDVDNGFDVFSSKYEVQLGSTIELIFTTRNHIHKLLDRTNGLVYEGNSNFQYISSSSDGKITFKEYRNDATLVFEPIKNLDWNKEVSNSFAMRQNMFPLIGTSAFQQLIINDSKGESRYNLNYDGSFIFARPRNQTSISTTEPEINFGIAYTLEGLIVSPAIELNGVSYETFVYDATSNSFIATVGSDTATIGFTNEPVFISDDVLDIGSLLDTFLYSKNLGKNSLTSLGFDALITQIDTSINPFGLSFNEFRLFTKPNTNGHILLRINTPNAADIDIFTGYIFTPKIENKKYFLEYVGPVNSDSATLESFIMPLINFFESATGIIYENKGSYTTDL